MANNAHYIRAEQGVGPRIVVRDDRGEPVTELELPAMASSADQADEELQAVGWTRSADWTATDDGWLAPVVAS